MAVRVLKNNYYNEIFFKIFDLNMIIKDLKFNKMKF